MNKIVIDTLGGDLPLQEILEGVNLCFEQSEDYQIVLVGPKKDIDDFFISKNKTIEVIDAEREITNSTNPVSMLYEQDDSALVKSLKYLKSNEDAKGLITVSATGCILVGSIFHLGLKNGLKFPVLGAILKHANGKEFLIADCGANIDVKDTDLVKFAKLGSEFMTHCLSIEKPRIGLISNGKEEGKGNALIKSAFKLLKEEKTLNFVGNIEACDCFNDQADVLVCDGMIGNVVIKLAESVANIVRSYGNCKEINEKVESNFDYNNHGGSVLIGTNKVIVKGHGSANRNTILACYQEITKLINGGF